MQRYELAAESRKLVEADDGPWVFYADVERLKAQLAEAQAENQRLRAAIQAHRDSFDTDEVAAEEDRQLWKALAGERGE